MLDRMMNSPALLEEVEKRVEKFQVLLRDRDIDGALIVQKVDIYYFSGTDQDAHLWIPASGQPILMVRKKLQSIL